VSEALHDVSEAFARLPLTPLVDVFTQLFWFCNRSDEDVSLQFSSATLKAADSANEIELKATEIHTTAILVRVMCNSSIGVFY
jgi:hypothetical protein